MINGVDVLTSMIGLVAGEKKLRLVVVVADNVTDSWSIMPVEVKNAS